MPRHASLGIVDLFTGIGGMSLGLAAVGRPLAYCEIDDACRGVIERRLPRAPIFRDVKQLRGARDIVPLLKGSAPYVIGAGFPCQGISSAGLGRGIVDDERSSLVSEVFRLARELVAAGRPPHAMFFENSPEIKRRGLDSLLRACRRMGFTKIAWVYLSASDVGGHHRRRRWYMLAARPTALPLPLPLATDQIHHAFVDERVPRLTQRKNAAQDRADRVVPATVSAAWSALVAALNERRSGEIAFAGEQKKTPDGLILSYANGETYATWCTPVHSAGHWYPRRYFVRRNRRVLATRVFHELGTQRRFGFTDVVEARARLALNPRWVEALMGFPVGWTS
jgi:site-specific DNA-cytosine methylase